MVKVIERSAEQQREIRERLESYRRDRDSLDAARADLLSTYPEEWVAVRGDRVFHARELDALISALRLAGVDATRTPREFLTRDEPLLLLQRDVIRGRFSPAPSVDGVLSFPRLASANVDATFLLDTGAMYSVAHPKDLKMLGVDIMTSFGGQERVSGRGVGGLAWYFLDDARLSFAHEDGREVDYMTPIRIAVPTDENADYPSVLGMDFLYAFRLVVSMPENLVSLDYLE